MKTKASKSRECSLRWWRREAGPRALRQEAESQQPCLPVHRPGGMAAAGWVKVAERVIPQEGREGLTTAC